MLCSPLGDSMGIERSELQGWMSLIGAGGEGRVYSTEFRLPGDSTALAYKEYIQPADSERSAEAAVQFWQGLGQDERDFLGRHAAWPRELVLSRGAVSGILMPLYRREFYFLWQDPGTGEMGLRNREFYWLAMDAAYRQARKADIRLEDRVERLSLLAQLAGAIAFLHERGWVFGNISDRNAMYALDPARLMLIDCDGAASIRDIHRWQGHMPGWVPPECHDGPSRQVLQDDVTDVYKLGLAVLRGMSGKLEATDPGKLKGQLDQDGLFLVSCALSPDRLMRPSAREIAHYLERQLPAQLTERAVPHTAAPGPGPLPVT